MEDTGISARVIEEIRQLAEKYSIEQVLLFGSRARGDYRRTSDIDLAVRGGDVVRFAHACSEETWTLLKFDIVDLGSDLQPELWPRLKRKEGCSMKKWDNFQASLKNLCAIYGRRAAV